MGQPRERIRTVYTPAGVDADEHWCVRRTPWPQVRCDPRRKSQRAAEAAAVAGRPGLEAALRLTGYQLREAVRLVATGARDPRLGSLLAQGGGRAATRALMSQQLQVWDKWGLSGYMDDDRKLLYRLLAGEVRAV
jgi:hypothetical protein